MKKQWRKRTLTFILSLVVLLSNMNIGTFAAEKNSDTQILVEENRETPGSPGDIVIVEDDSSETETEESQTANENETNSVTPSRESASNSSIPTLIVEDGSGSSEKVTPNSEGGSTEESEEEPQITPYVVDPSTGKADMRIAVIDHSGFLMSAGQFRGDYAPIFYSARWSGSNLGGVLPNGHYVYCIEPEVTLASDNSYREAGSLGDKNYLMNLTTSRITTRGVIFAMMGRVLKVCGPDITMASDIINNPAQATKYLAAQVIIWQITEGDMDANFVCHGSNWKTVYDISSVPYWNSAPSGGRSIKSWYDEWITKLQNSKKIPSFMSRGSASAPEYDMDSTTITLTDTNNVLQYVELTASNSSVKLSVDGNKLTISNPNRVDFSLTASNTICDGAREPVPIITTNLDTGAARQKTVTASTTNLADPVQGFAKVKAAVNATLSITKVSSENSATRLTGATFTVYNSQGTKLGTMSHQGNGVYTYANVGAGTYIIRETTAPSGYERDTNDYRVTVSQSKTYTISNNGGSYFTNTPIKGNITLTKVSSENTGTKLSGATFGVYQSNGTTKIGNMTYQGNGVYTYSGLKVGTYVVKELTAPSGYHKDTGSYTVTISASKTYTVANSGGYFTNRPIKGKITLTKVDGENTSNKLSGAVFTVYNASGSEVGKMTDKGNGVYEIANLYAGKYTIKETTAPTGFLADGKTYTVTISDSKTYTVSNSGSNFVNAPIKGHVQVKKVSSDGTPLKGASFGIYHASDDKLLGLMTDNGNGTYSYQNLRYGDYYVRELAAPSSYYTDSAKVSFSIRENGKTVTAAPSGQSAFENEPHKGDLHITKVVEQDDLLHSSLAGYEFRITCAATGYDQVHTTDEKGEIYISDLPVGTYTIHEIEKEGTNTDGSNFQFNLPADQTVEVRANQLTNARALGTAASGYALASLTYDASSRQWSGKTVSGQSSSGFVLTGNDIVTPVGKTMVFEADVYVSSSCNWNVDAKIQYTNASSSIKTSKSSNAGRLTGGQWQPIWFCYTNNGSVPARDALSYVFFSGYSGSMEFALKNVRMTIAENGKADMSGTVASDQNAVTNVTIENKLRRGTVTITKIDADNPQTTLSGAKLLLEKKVYFLPSETVQEGAEKDEYGSYYWRTVSEETTNAEGKVFWENLTIGEYRITETKAAPGYQLLMEPVYFKLPYQAETEEIEWSYEDSTVSIDQEFYIGDQAIYQMPSSGGYGVWLSILGTTLAVAGSVLLIYLYRKTFGKEGNEKK